MRLATPQAILKAFLFTVAAIGATSPVGRAQSEDPRLTAIDQYARQVQSDWKVPGLAIGIVRGDKLVFARGYGVRRLDEAGDVDADTLFAIASNTKSFVAGSLAILVDQGKLSWDDPVSRYLPELQLQDRLASQELTIRDLLCHRCGLATFSGDLLWYETDYSPMEILQRARFLKPTSSFRSQYGYQNLMFIAAGQVIERVSGQPCSQFVREQILNPLAMTRTTTSVRDLDDNAASPHNESQGSLRALPFGNVDNCWGACGLNSSVNDLSQWLRLHLSEGKRGEQQIISARQIWEMAQPNIAMKISPEAARQLPDRNFLAYGLGWVLYDYHGQKVVGHSGGLDGMISQTAMVPELGLGVVVLTNSESPAATILRDRILDTFLGVSPQRDWNKESLLRRQQGNERSALAARRVDESRVANAPPSLPLDGYVGSYRCPMYGDAEISREGETLILQLVPAANLRAELVHWHFNTFEIKWLPTTHYNFPRGFVNFTIDGQGQTDRLIIDQPNDDFWFYEFDLRRVRQ